MSEPRMITPERTRVLGTFAPCTGMEFGYTKFHRSYRRVMNHTRNALCGPNEVIAEIPAVHSFPNAARDYQCRYFKGDWLCMFDADMVYAPDTVVKLLEAQKQIENEHGECGVVTGIYPMRNIPPKDILIHDYDEKTNLWRSFSHDRIDLEKPGKCDAAGAGALLIMRWVVERIVLELNVQPFQVWGPLKRASLGEAIGAGTDDLAFCRRLQVLDPPVQLWYTSDVTPGHLSTVPLNMHDWMKHAQRQRQIRVDVGDAVDG